MGYSLLKVASVGLGGFLGSVLRFGTAIYFQSMSQRLSFPVATLTVNVIGCLLIGFLVQLAENQKYLSQEMHGFLVIGFLGGLTTFSSFGNETLILFKLDQLIRGFLNITLNVAFGLAAVWLGRFVGSRLSNLI